MNKRKSFEIGPIQVFITLALGVGIMCLTEHAYGWAAISGLSAIVWAYVGRN